MHMAELLRKQGFVNRAGFEVTRGQFNMTAFHNLRIRNRGATAFVESACSMSRHMNVRAKRLWLLQSAQEQQPSQSMFHNRDVERKRFNSLFRMPPSAIQVILGPRSCGKTALLREHLENNPKVVYVNCREIQVNTPEAFVTTVLELLEQKSPKQAHDDVRAFLKEALDSLVRLASGVKVNMKDVPVPAVGTEDVTLSISALAKSWLETNKRSDLQQNMTVIYTAIRKLLDAWDEPSSNKGYKRPVLVIDEANKLQAWRANHNSELLDLMSFLVCICKESQRCHVLLATSEYAFQAWLNTAIGSRFWKPIVIGDFTEVHARKFLEKMLQEVRECDEEDDDEHATWPELDDVAWSKVFKVCGGNAGDLLRIATETQLDDWDKALQQLWSVEVNKLSLLAVGVDGAWTPAQFAEVAIQLLDSSHHALPQVEVERMLGRHVVKTANVSQQRQAGVPVLQKLVEANALSLRPLSDWAQDIPAEAFGRGGAVVTAPSTMDLYCLAELRGQLEADIEYWKNSETVPTE